MVSIAFLIVAVLAFSALLGWALLRSATAVERARREPRYRRRLLIVDGAICGAGAVFCVVQVSSMQSRAQVISSLVMELINILLFVQLARNLRTPPD